MAAIAGWLLLGESLSWTALIAMVVTLTGIGISILSRGEGHKVKLTLPLKGILLGVGAGIGQGVGLVLSKIGLTHYLEALPSDAPEAMETMLPFASTMIRAIVGSLGFLALMALQKDLGRLKAAVHDATGMRYALVMTLFGPVVGVSLSLMAVEYTNAGIASTLMALTPIIIILPSYWLFREPITWKAVLGAVISVVGVSLFFLA
jgi:drug/metabolite transporter (DMT)-like permease